MSTSAERQAVWHFNSSTGSNRNTGVDTAHALRDLEELVRRFGKGTAGLRQATTITLDNDAGSTDPLNVPFACYQGASLSIVGTPTTVASGTFTGVTAINRATQQFQQVTDSGLSGGFGAYVDHLIRIPSGARSGAIAIVAKDLTAGAARTGRWQIPNLTNANNSTSTAPQVGDPYNILTLPSLKIGGFSVEPYCADTNAFATFSNLAISSAFVLSSSIKARGGIPVYLSGCSLANLAIAMDRSLAVACRIGNTGSGAFSFVDLLASTSTQWWSCVLFEAFFLGTGAALTLDKDTLLQDNFHKFTVSEGAELQIGTAATFDHHSVTGSGVVHGVTSSLPVADGTDIWWGSNNASHVDVSTRGCIRYVTKPTVASLSASEVSVGGTTMLWSDVPAENAANGARVSAFVT